MKYIILPLYRLIIFLMSVLIMYPILLILFTIWGFWDFKWMEKYKELFSLHYYTQDVFESHLYEEYYIYKTPLDFLFDRKKWIKKSKQ